MLRQLDSFCRVFVLSVLCAGLCVAAGCGDGTSGPGDGSSNGDSNGSNDDNNGENNGENNDENNGESNGTGNDSDDAASWFEASADDDEGDEVWSGSGESSSEEVEEGRGDVKAVQSEDTVLVGLQEEDGARIDIWIRSSESEPAPGTFEVARQPELPHVLVDFADDSTAVGHGSTGRAGTIEVETCPEKTGDLLEGRLVDVEVGLPGEEDGEFVDVRTVQADFEAVVIMEDEGEFPCGD